jgi:hypothetical protein
VLDKVPLTRQFSRKQIRRYFTFTPPPPPEAVRVSLQTRDLVMLRLKRKFLIIDDDVICLREQCEERIFDMYRRFRFPTDIVRVHHHESLFRRDEMESLTYEERVEAEKELRSQLSLWRNHTMIPSFSNHQRTSSRMVYSSVTTSPSLMISKNVPAAASSLTHPSASLPTASQSVPDIIYLID